MWKTGFYSAFFARKAFLSFFTSGNLKSNVMVALGWLPKITETLRDHR